MTKASPGRRRRPRSENIDRGDLNDPSEQRRLSVRDRRVTPRTLTPEEIGQLSADTLLGPDATSQLLPFFRYVCREYPRWRLVFGKREPATEAVGRAAKALVEALRKMPSTERDALRRTVPFTGMDVQQLERMASLASGRPTAQKGRTPHYARQTLFWLLGAALRDAGFGLSKTRGGKRGAKFARTAEVLLRAVGEDVPRDLFRDIDRVVELLSVRPEVLAVPKNRRRRGSIKAADDAAFAASWASRYKIFGRRIAKCEGMRKRR